MPTRDVNFQDLSKTFATQDATKEAGDDLKSVISTPLGLALLEIQGELNLPSIKPDGLSPEEEDLYQLFQVPEMFTKQPALRPQELEEEIRQAVRFGRLERDPQDPKRLTLFISKSQRLLGVIEKLEPPLGVLRITTTTNVQPKDLYENSVLESVMEPEAPKTQNAQIIDVIRQKIVFRFRPLPIMSDQTGAK